MRLRGRGDDPEHGGVGRGDCLRSLPLSFFRLVVPVIMEIPLITTAISDTLTQLLLLLLPLGVRCALQGPADDAPQLNPALTHLIRRLLPHR